MFDFKISIPVGNSETVIVNSDSRKLLEQKKSEYNLDFLNIAFKSGNEEGFSEDLAFKTRISPPVIVEIVLTGKSVEKFDENKLAQEIRAQFISPALKRRAENFRS